MASKNAKYSRRNFIKSLGAFVGSAIILRNAFSQDPIASSKPFNFLVVGDSIISGQGLEEGQKSYMLVRDWLEKDIFANSRQVALKVKAHSGASINLLPVESDALRKAGIDENKAYTDEVNVNFPSIRSQADTALKEYENGAAVDLILLTGSITDTRLTVILSPFQKNDDLRQAIVKHCYEDMSVLLKHMAEIFPNALIVLVGYYPFISKYSLRKQIVRHVMEIEDLPDPLQAIVNNSVGRQLYKYYIKKMIERSMIWATGSTLELRKAVEKLNTESGTRRAIFVESPLKEENSLGAKNSLVFELDEKDRLTDPMAAKRKALCTEIIPPLSKATKLKLRTRVCKMAGIGHPNPAGARAIAEAIQATLNPVITPSRSNL